MSVGRRTSWQLVVKMVMFQCGSISYCRILYIMNYIEWLIIIDTSQLITPALLLPPILFLSYNKL